MSMALEVDSDEDEFHFIVFVHVSHEGGIINVVFDGAVENQRDGDFGVLNFLQYFLVVLGNKLLKIIDEFERFVRYAFEVCLYGRKKVLKVKTDVLNVTDETFNCYFLRIHYDTNVINDCWVSLLQNLLSLFIRSKVDFWLTKSIGDQFKLN